MPTALLVGSVVATLVALHILGRIWWCECGQASLWSGDVWGKHNSQHVFDPYSITHLTHGLLFFLFFAVTLPRLSLAWRFVLSNVLECAWEIVENTPLVIHRYRNATAALGYEGDSIANSLGDILSCVAGFWLAGRLGPRRSLILFLLIELFLLVWIRDNLTLNVIMLLCPIDAIRQWQQGG